MKELAFQSQPSNEPPFISLLVPAFNVEKYLDEALVSAEATKSCPLEIIVIDDGSTDSTSEIAENHARADSRIRVVSQANAGYGAALNAGIALARGVYVAILEPDDYLVPGALDKLFNFLRNDSSIEATDYPDLVKATYYRVLQGLAESADSADPAEHAGSADPTGPANPHADAEAAAKQTPKTKANASTQKETKILCSYAHLFKTGTRLNRPECAELLTRHPSIWSAIYRRAFLNEKHISFKEVPGGAWVDGPFAVQTLLEAKDAIFYDHPLYNYREDNPEASSAQDISAFAPERFCEMVQIQKEISPHDKAMRSALAVVGLNYFDRIVRSNASLKPGVSEKLKTMLFLLEADEIKGAEQIAPHVREEALAFMGHRFERISSLSYYRYVLKRALVELRNNGLGPTLDQIKQFKKRRGK